MDVIVSFTYTTVTNPSSGGTVYKLFIDGKPVATNNNPDVTAFIAVLSVGFHIYEIKAYPQNPGAGQYNQVLSTVGSRAAGGSFEVVIPTSPADNRFFVGTTNNYYADALIQYILNFFDTTAGYANYAIDNTIGAGVTWLVNQFTNQGASSSSSNYNSTTGGYKPFTGTGSSFSDNYPIGAQCHVEIRGEDNSINVIDFTAGELPTPNPVTIPALPSGFLSSIVCEAGNPPSNGQVTLNYSGDPLLGDTKIQFENGSQFTISHADIISGFTILTSGTIFDYLIGLSDIDSLLYLVFDPNEVIIQGGFTSFTPQ